MLENYHVSETFKLILDKKNNCNILEGFKDEEFRVIRKRMISCILATDMSYHMKHFIDLRSKLQLMEISDGKNIAKLTKEDSNNINSNQQMILDNTIHLCDISNPSKIGNVYDKWVDLVLNEFFNQGDLEKKSNLPISFMCDRETTSRPKSQLGFMEKIVKPYFELYCNMVPEIRPYLDNLNNNFERYKLLSNEEDNNNSNINYNNKMIVDK